MDKRALSKPMVTALELFVSVYRNVRPRGWTVRLITMMVGSRYDTLRPRQNGLHFAEHTFKHIFLNKNIRTSFKLSLKFVPRVPTNNIQVVQIMTWHRSGDKPLSEPMMVRLPTNICVTRPQWVNSSDSESSELYILPVKCKSYVNCNPVFT